MIPAWLTILLEILGCALFLGGFWACIQLILQQYADAISAELHNLDGRPE